jgi:hypothetical protein
VVIVCGDGQLAIGAVVLVQTKFTVAPESFHPLAFGAGVAVAVIFGGVSAMFNVTVAAAEFPATSVTAPLTA